MSLLQNYQEKIDALWQKYMENPIENKELLFPILFLSNKIEELELAKIETTQYNERFNKAVKLLQDSKAMEGLVTCIAAKISERNSIEDLRFEIEKLKRENEELRNKDNKV